MEQRRKGEPEGKRLTPGERAINWAKAFAIIIPLFGTGWFMNSDYVNTTVRDWVYPEKPAEILISEETLKKEPENFNCPEPITKIIERETIIKGECDISAHIKADH